MGGLTEPAVIDNKALILDLIEWIAARPRTHAEVMEVWRTSCPRLPIWEDANDHGFVVRTFNGPGGAMVAVSEAGLAFLRSERPSAPAP